MLSFQHTALGHITVTKMVAIVSWLCLFLAGIWRWPACRCTRGFDSRWRCQSWDRWGLYLRYGNETFLYSLIGYRCL